MQYRCNIARIYKSNVYGSTAAPRNGAAIPQTVSITHYEKGEAEDRERRDSARARNHTSLSRARKVRRAERRISREPGLLTLNHNDVVENTPARERIAESI